MSDGPDLLASTTLAGIPPEPRSAARRASWTESAARRWGTCGTLILAAFLALGVDLPVSRAMVEDHALRPLQHFLKSIEPFGQPPVVIGVSVGILLCGGRRRGVAFRIAAGALLAGVAGDIVKLCVARIRPQHFD